MQSAVSHHEAAARLLAGDLAGAKERLLTGYVKLDEMGEKALLATTAALLARVAYEQGSYAECDRFCTASEDAATSEDLWSQFLWRGARAKLLAREGRIDEAEPLAREAVALVEATDLLTHRGDALLDLGDVLSAADRAADAEVAVRDALELFTRKGNAISAERARALLPIRGVATTKRR
jgi:hypothetical protein